MSAPTVKPYPWKCGACGRREVVPAEGPFSTTVSHDGREYLVELPDLAIPRCQACGQAVLDDAANRRITAALREQVG